MKVKVLKKEFKLPAELYPVFWEVSNVFHYPQKTEDFNFKNESETEEYYSIFEIMNAWAKNNKKTLGIVDSYFQSSEGNMVFVVESNRPGLVVGKKGILASMFKHIFGIEIMIKSV